MKGGGSGARTEAGAVPEALLSAFAANEPRLQNCVHCGFCLPACPTYTRLGDEADSPRGRLHLMRAVIEGRLEPGSDAFQLHLDRCLGCRACETACPSGVEYGLLLERAREVAGGARPLGTLSRLLLAFIAGPIRFRIWMGGSRLLRGSGVLGPLARVIPGRAVLLQGRIGLAMLAASAPWRRLRRVGRVRAVGSDGDGVGVTLAPGSRGRVACLTGCVQDGLFRRVNEATRRVLVANGWEVVDVPGQGCCGALHAHAGRLSEASRMAYRNVRAFSDAGIDWIVVNAAGCGAAMREYGELVGSRGRAEGAAAHELGRRVRDLSELLAGEGTLPRRGAPIEVRVAYDPPCHLLHGQGVRQPPVALLRSIPGVELVQVPSGDECCGGAGIYGITHPELGGRIGEDKVRAVLSTRAEVLATGNPGCAMQIGGGLILKGASVRVVHPVELLDESYRRGGLYEREAG